MTISERLSNLLPQCLCYIFAELTSINFTAKIQRIQNRQGTSNAKKSVTAHLKRYEDIKGTSQIVRNDLTTPQQCTLTQRLISNRKMKEIKTIAEGRGRKLKAKDFPALGLALESLTYKKVEED